jgi:hypothetical protein
VLYRETPVKSNRSSVTYNLLSEVGFFGEAEKEWNRGAYCSASPRKPRSTFVLDRLFQE